MICWLLIFTLINAAVSYVMFRIAKNQMAKYAYRKASQAGLHAYEAAMEDMDAHEFWCH